jgi:hypothetical protein
MPQPSRLLGLAFAGALLTVPALAQPAAMQRLRGTVVSVSGDTLVVHAGGRSVSVALPADWQPTAVVASSLAAIAPGSFIGTAATGPDSHLVAREVVVFPPAMKGAGEGHYPWDLGPESTMTNATVDAEAVGTDGRSLTLSYKGGQVVVLVPPRTPVVTLEPGQRSMVTPGAHVFVVAAPGGGGLTARRVAVGKNGLTPPM